MTTTKVRKSVPLDAADVSRVDQFDEDDILRRVAARHAGTDDIGSQAELMHTLLIAGLDALEHEADEERYASLATSQDDEDRAYRAAMRRRRTA